MKNNRREFLKLTGLLGASVAGGGLLQSFTGADDLYANNTPPLLSADGFNMSGYAAPKLDTVRIGFIGIGNRGAAAVFRVSHIQGVDIKGLCDIRPEKANAAKQKLKDSPHQPELYTGNENEWKKMCERDDIDLIYISTPWHLHTTMSVYAMKHGKHVCVEVPAATTIEECWELVETSEKTKKHCMMLENCCYGSFELLTLNMARQNFFGEIIHCEGAYIHDLMEGNFSKDKYYDFWRLKENLRNGNLYPTHGLGPVSQIMNLNRGDQMDYLVSLSSNDFMMGKRAKELAEKDPTYQPYANKSFRGNMNTSMIKTQNGRSIMIQHDVTSPRPYSRIHMVSGTKATAQGFPLPEKIAVGHKWADEAEFKALEEKYKHEISKKIGDVAKKFGGHGGMDFIMDWRTIDCLRNGIALDIDVYDTALWSAIGPLSEKSIANRSNSVDVPDFTKGKWKSNQPVDVKILTGANTGVSPKRGNNSTF
ncbi:MAG: Gfo/Idh/MocA family oxidoreductase [Chryseobacterium sp.]|nr:MAG: Gfo/Idh/MocA family oxidoreductase [Chryseobacterium sp.]